MPGQRKRKRQQRRDLTGLSREADRFGPAAGRWELRYTTKDESEWRAELRRLRAEEPGLDSDAVRLDMLCGRSTHPTTYQLSVFVPHPVLEEHPAAPLPAPAEPPAAALRAPEEPAATPLRAPAEHEHEHPVPRQP